MISKAINALTFSDFSIFLQIEILLELQFPLFIKGILPYLFFFLGYMLSYLKFGSKLEF